MLDKDIIIFIFKAFQTDAVTSKSWCFGPNGEYRTEVSNFSVDGDQLRRCFAMFEEWKLKNSKSQPKVNLKSSKKKRKNKPKRPTRKPFTGHVINKW